MGQQHCLSWSVSLLLLLLVRGHQCMSVHIEANQPVFVIPTTSLVLQARIDHAEKVSTVTWEKELKSGVKVTLAKFPGKSPNGRVSLEQRGATLKLERFTAEDSGVYTLTVTDQTGAKTSATSTVEEYKAVHHVSVSVNVSHSSLLCGEAWGTDPKFTWLHERVTITETVGHVSPDGKTLYISSTPVCGHFTCMVSNKLGHSSATYTAVPCVTEGKGAGVAVVCLIILLVLGGVLAILLWRRRRRYSNRGERLQDNFEDQLED